MSLIECPRDWMLTMTLFKTERGQLINLELVVLIDKDVRYRLVMVNGDYIYLSDDDVQSLYILHNIRLEEG